MLLNVCERYLLRNTLHRPQTLAQDGRSTSSSTEDLIELYSFLGWRRGIAVTVVDTVRRILRAGSLLVYHQRLRRLGA